MNIKGTMRKCTTDFGSPTNMISGGLEIIRAAYDEAARLADDPVLPPIHRMLWATRAQTLAESMLYLLQDYGDAAEEWGRAATKWFMEKRRLFKEVTTD